MRPQDEGFFVYILASRLGGTLYIGVTGRLRQRIWEHRNKVVPGFSRTYGVDRLVWFERHETIASARLREKQMKAWKREWKIKLIEAENPHWADLFPTLTY